MQGAPDPATEVAYRPRRAQNTGSVRPCRGRRAEARGGGAELGGGTIFLFPGGGGWTETLDDESCSESGFSEIHVERLDGAVCGDAKFPEFVGSPSAVGDFDANVDGRGFGLNAREFVVSEGERRVGLFFEDVGEREVEKAFACAVIEEKRVGEAPVPCRETTLFFKMRIEKKMPREYYLSLIHI